MSEPVGQKSSAHDADQASRRRSRRSTATETTSADSASNTTRRRNTTGSPGSRRRDDSQPLTSRQYDELMAAGLSEAEWSSHVRKLAGPAGFDLMKNRSDDSGDYLTSLRCGTILVEIESCQPRSETTARIP